jgi:hypothetical protein
MPSKSSKPSALVPVTSDPENIVEQTVVQTLTRLPGAAVESAADKAANDQVRSETAASTAPAQPNPIIDTRTPAANLASRDNIVPDGPGTVADFLS